MNKKYKIIVIALVFLSLCILNFIAKTDFGTASSAATFI